MLLLVIAGLCLQAPLETDDGYEYDTGIEYAERDKLMATGDILSCTIRDDGWSADVVIEGFVDGAAYNFGTLDDAEPTTATPKVTFTVVSEGYNASGVLGTITRTVYGTHVVRKAYPNHATLDETEGGGNLSVRIALSEFIYDDDNTGGGKSGTAPTVTIAAGWCTNSGSGGGSETSAAATNLTVTNSSTLDYPKVVGNWSWPDRIRIGSGVGAESSLKLRCTAFHAFAQNANPVACVAFSATDEHAHTATSTQTAMQIDATMPDALKVSEYVADLAASTFDQGDVITANFIAYPWVGDADSILDTSVNSAYTDDDWRPRPHYYLCDKSGTFGVTYAVVDPVSGNDTTGVASPTLATAEAAPCLTIAYAIKKIRDYNNTNLSRPNCSAGVVYLLAGTYTSSGADVSTVFSGDKCWVIVTPHSSTNEAGVVINTNGTSANRTFKSTYVQFKDVTFTQADANYIVRHDVTGTRLVWLNSCTLNYYSGGGSYGLVYESASHASQATHCTGQYCEDDVWRFYRGNTEAAAHNGMFPYNHVGNVITRADGASWELTYWSESVGGGTTLLGNGAVLAYNSVYKAQGSILSAGGVADWTTGFALIGNVFERHVQGAATATCTTIHAQETGSQYGCINLIAFHNTFAGQRCNWLYNVVGTNTTKTNNHVKYNLFKYLAYKDDEFATDGTMVGNWSVGNAVGYYGNLSGDGAFQPDYIGIDGKRGPSGGPTLDYSFTDDNSITGDGTGLGNYLITASSIAKNRVASGQAAVPYDVSGTAIQNGGSGAAGAFQLETAIPVFMSHYREMLSR